MSLMQFSMNQQLYNLILIENTINESVLIPPFLESDFRLMIMKNYINKYNASRSYMIRLMTDKDIVRISRRKMIGTSLNTKFGNILKILINT